MPFDETRNCGNCLFRLTPDHQIDQCRFNAPPLKFMMSTMLDTDWLRHNKSIFPPCPGPACGQWQPFDEPEIIELDDEVIEEPTFKEDE